ncbi:MAG: amino acid ABC transporter ATP-binding protein [Desulfovibrio sp.]|jgi:L-cystine transport system ATP-binding protein|nr:amino acid ABC transporter ATP-binding protein [Desulfovibrio sp.]
MLQATDVKKTFGHDEVLKGVSVSVKKGEIVVILGPSGSGKSTFLRCLNFLERAESGQLRIGDLQVDLGHARKKDIFTLRRRTAMVFQSYNLFSNRTALENVVEGPIIVQKRPKDECIEEGKALLDMVGLSDKYDFYPSQLSGGQQQRVGIARAMSLKPEVLLFDEPTSALDPELVGEVLDVIAQLARKGMTMIVVTHEMQFAYNIATHVFVMDKGVIVEEGSPRQIFLEPREERTQQFLKRISSNYTYEV